MTNYIDSWCQIWYQRWSNPPKLQSGTIIILQVWLCSWCIYNDARELKILIQVQNDKLFWFRCNILYQRLSNPPKLQSGTINVLHYACIPGAFIWDWQFEYNSGLTNFVDIWYLLSGMIQSSKTPVRNHQCPPRMTVIIVNF